MRPASDLNLLEIALRSRAEKIRGYIKSSARVVELLKPEMVKFEARTGHDVYTVRMSVDHASSIRTQTKEAEELEQAADALAVIEADRKQAREEVVREIIKLIEDYHDDTRGQDVRPMWLVTQIERKFLGEKA